MKANIFVNFFATIVSFFKNLFHKEKVPTRKQVLSNQYADLDSENQTLFEILEAMKDDWRDPYVFDKVCKLVSKVPCINDRYPGSEQLHTYAGGIFYYIDDKNQFREVPYSQMCEEYNYFLRNGGIPKDLLTIKYFPAIYEYIPAIQRTWGRMELIKEHVEIRKKKNDELMDEILKEYYSSIAA